MPSSTKGIKWYCAWLLPSLADTASQPLWSKSWGLGLGIAGWAVGASPVIVHLKPGYTWPSRKQYPLGTFLIVQWLRLWALNAWGPGQGPKISHAGGGVGEGGKERKKENSFLSIERPYGDCLCYTGPNWPGPCSVQFSRSVMSDSLWPHGLHHARPPCPSPTPGV